MLPKLDSSKRGVHVSKYSQSLTWFTWKRRFTNLPCRYPKPSKYLVRIGVWHPWTPNTSEEIPQVFITRKKETWALFMNNPGIFFPKTKLGGGFQMFIWRKWSNSTWIFLKKLGWNSTTTWNPNIPPTTPCKEIYQLHQLHRFCVSLTIWS